ncbi:MAG TPA: hypothetical protein VFO84_00180 [Dehalococcoidia bacterium]|nr:hypothetical protein [Dehalococcoidia bacterium]
MKIASAPMFFMKAESAATAEDSTATCIALVCIRGTRGFMRFSTSPDRPIAALTTRARAHDDDDVVAEASERFVGFDDAACDRRQQRQQGDQVVTDVVPYQETDRAENNGERERLIERHALPFERRPQHWCLIAVALGHGRSAESEVTSRPVAEYE